MPVRLFSACLVAAAFFSGALSMAGQTLGFSGDLFIGSAQAQSAPQNPIEGARKGVESLIDHLRGRDMPEGIFKTNGRLEATEVDVAAKYPGRLATVNVNEGDEVTAGQVVATISSPETEAQLRNAQAQVLKAKEDLAAAVATVAQRKGDVDFTTAVIHQNRIGPAERSDRFRNLPDLFLCVSPGIVSVGLPWRRR